MSSDTISAYAYGSPFTFGDRHNPEFYHFSKSGARAVNVKSEPWVRLHTTGAFTLSTFKFVHYPLGLLLQDSVLNILESHIVKDAAEYYTFPLYITTRKERCDELEPCPDSSTTYIKTVYYGLELSVVVPVIHFPKTNTKMTTLLKNACLDVDTLTQAQKQAECKVLTNGMASQTLSLEQVFQIADQFSRGELEWVETVIQVDCRKAAESRKPNADLDKDLKYFVTRLYQTYRKIEMKLKEAGYDEFLEVPEPGLTMVDIYQNLKRAKEAFKDLDKDSIDFFSIYPVLKTLFWRYREYIKFELDHELDVLERKNVTGSFSDFQSWFKALNDWKVLVPADFPVTVTGSLIPEGFDAVADKILEIEKLENIKIKADEGLKEPLLKLRLRKDTLFGFVDAPVSGQGENVDAETAVSLTIPCPQKCTADERKWICRGCGDVVASSRVYLVCSCGSRFFDPRLFVCNSLKHAVEHPVPEPRAAEERMDSIVREITSIGLKIDDSFQELNKSVDLVM